MAEGGHDVLEGEREGVLPSHVRTQEDSCLLKRIRECGSRRRADKVDKNWESRVVVSSLCTRTTPTKGSPTLDCPPSLSLVLSRSSYSDLTLSIIGPFILLPVCLCPFACARVLCSIIMDSFFGWTATALTAYLAGCDALEDDIPASNGTESSSHGGSVSSLLSLNH